MLQVAGIQAFPTPLLPKQQTFPVATKRTAQGIAVAIATPYWFSWIEVIKILLEYNTIWFSSPVCIIMMLILNDKITHSIPVTGFSGSRPPHGPSSRMQSFEPKPRDALTQYRNFDGSSLTCGVYAVHGSTLSRIE